MDQVICAYSISGGYGPISRFVYYALLAISFIFHKREWVVGGTLGAAMVFSSITAVHGVALGSTRGKQTADLDLVPVFAICAVGMLAGGPLLVWSKTLREARTPVRAVIFLWTCILLIGYGASVIGLKSLPSPVPCQNQSDPNCGLQCNVTLPMRDGQSISVVVFPFKFIPWISGGSHLLVWYAPVMVLMNLALAEGRAEPREQALRVLRTRGMTKRTREKSAGHIMCCAYLSPLISLGITITYLIITEVMLLGPQGLPIGENITAIGQWGPLVGATFAFIGSLIQVVFPDPERPGSRGPTLMLEERGKPTITSKAISSVNAVTPYNTDSYFSSGQWWGRQSDGLQMQFKGKRWMIDEGVIQQLHDSPPTLLVEVVETINSSTDSPIVDGAVWGKSSEGCSFDYMGKSWIVEGGILRCGDKYGLPLLPDSSDPPPFEVNYLPHSREAWFRVSNKVELSHIDEEWKKNLPSVFKNGDWYFRVRDGFIFTHDGIRWTISDGALRRLADDSKGDSEARRSFARYRLFDASGYFRKGQVWGETANGITVKHGPRDWTVEDGVLKPIDLDSAAEKITEKAGDY